MKFCPHCGTLVPNPNEPCSKCGLTANAFSTSITTANERTESFIPLLLSIFALITAIIYSIIAKNISAGTPASFRWLAEHKSLVKWNTFLETSGFSACGILAICLGAKNFECEFYAKTVFAYLFSFISFIIYGISIF